MKPTPISRMKNVPLTLLLVFVIVSSNIGFSQTNLIDSIQNVLNEGQDTDSTLLYMSKHTRNGDSNSTAFANLGLNYAMENDLKEWQVVFLLDKARINKFSKENTESIKETLEAIQIIEENNLGEERKSQAKFMLAFYLNQIGAYNEAIEIRKSQIDWIIAHDNDGRYWNHIMAIGLIYYGVQQYDSSIVYFKMGLDYAENKSQGKDKASALNNIGLGYFQLNMLDSAKYYFEMARPIFEMGKTKMDSLMAGLVGGNISQCYPIKGNEKRVEQLLVNEIRVTKRCQAFSTLPTAYLRMSELYEEQKKYKIAIAYIDSAYQVAFSSQEFDGTRKIQLKILQKYMDILEKVNDQVSALKYARKYIEIYESVYGEAATNVLIRSRSAYQIAGIQRELELKKTRVLKLENEEQYSKLKTGLIIAISISIILIALIINLKMRSDYKKNKVIEEYSKQLLETSIESKNQMLTQTMLNLTRKKEFSKELLSRLKEVVGMDKGFVSSIQMFISNEIKMDESLLGMDKYISKLDKDFFTKLKLQFPQLSTNDIKLCGLIRMDLSNKELAIVMNITPESMKSRKTRMSRKMNLPPGTILFELLKKI